MKPRIAVGPLPRPLCLCGHPASCGSAWVGVLIELNSGSCAFNKQLHFGLKIAGFPDHRGTWNFLDLCPELPAQA